MSKSWRGIVLWSRSTSALALVVGKVAVDDDRERVDLVAGEQDVDLDQVRGPVADRLANPRP